MIQDLPHRWIRRPLIEVATLQRGYDLPVKQRKVGDVPIFAANGPVGFHDVARVEGPGVVTGRSGTIGKVRFVTGGFWPLNTSLFVKDFHGNDAKFVYYLLSWMRLERFHEGTGVPTLNRNNVHGIEVPLPPLPEQRRIAAILDQADAIRRKRQKAIELTEKFLKSVFLEMFGDPVTNPKGWEMRAISSMCHLVRGSSPRPKGDTRYYGGPVARLMVADITRDGWSVIPRIDSLTIEGAKRSRPVDAGTIVMAVSGNVGLVSELAVDACVHDGFVAFTNLNKDQIEPRYLMLTLYFLKVTHQSRQAGAIFQNLTTHDIKTLEIPVPPISHQRKLLEIFKYSKGLESHLTCAHTGTEGLFNSLVQRAFRGELSPVEVP